MRQSAVSNGTPITERPLEKRCRAVWVVNIQTGRVVAFVKLKDGRAIEEGAIHWDRSGNQRQFRSSGERNQQRLVPLVSPHRKRTKPSPSLFRSTEERRSPESCSSFRSREQPRAEVITVVLGCRTWATFRGCSLSVPSAAKLWRASVLSDRRAQC